MNVHRVARSFESRWKQARLDAVIPGGLWYNRAPQETDKRPYAALTIEEDDDGLILTSDNKTYLQRFTVVIKIWGTDGVPATGALADGLSLIFENQARAMPMIPGARWVDMLPTPDALTVDPDMRQGKDVLVAEACWECLIQFGGNL